MTSRLFEQWRYHGEDHNATNPAVSPPVQVGCDYNTNSACHGRQTNLGNEFTVLTRQDEPDRASSLAGFTDIETRRGSVESRFKSLDSQRPQNHQWSLEDKIVLSILKRWYTNSWDDITLVFNTALKPRLEAVCGDRGIPKSKLCAQWGTLISHQVLDNEVFRVDFANMGHAFGGLHVMILQAALRAGVVLDLRHSEDEVLEQRLRSNPMRRRIVSEHSDTTVTSFESGGNESEGNDWALPVRRRLFGPQLRNQLDDASAQLATSLPRPFGPTIKAPKSSKPFPPLLFRVWNGDSQGVNTVSGFRAGKFASSQCDTIAYDLTEDELLAAVDSHIGIKRAASPFISFTDSIIWCFVKAYLTGGMRGGDCQITAIDGRAAQSTTKIFHAAPLLTALKESGAYLAPNVRRYNGIHEYLVFGAVPSSTILGTFSVQHFESLCAGSLSLQTFWRFGLLYSRRFSTKRVRSALRATAVFPDETLGNAVGLLAYSIDGSIDDTDSWIIQALIENVIQCWAVQRNPHTWKESENFVTGLRRGMQGTLPPHSIFGGVLTSSPATCLDIPSNGFRSALPATQIPAPTLAYDQNDTTNVMPNLAMEMNETEGLEWESIEQLLALPSVETAGPSVPVLDLLANRTGVLEERNVIVLSSSEEDTEEDEKEDDMMSAVGTESFNGVASQRDWSYATSATLDLALPS